MSQALQAFQQFLTDLRNQLGNRWLPMIEGQLLLFWQWLLANPAGALALSAIFLLWACLVVRKSTHEGWNFPRVFLLVLLLAFGLAAMAVAVHFA